ncbi:LppU/SCO3897 family protein [Pseudonocardia sp. TRM90224]|uniref:LppU/SCO3897 family protein n=1 Tax=Pseudonocardia sp. TRM90224 TaxID=2812678 RepID=UPI001E5A000A|nr:hypothetical protein [Pseudonocardia sp. TRM90224]
MSDGRSNVPPPHPLQPLPVVDGRAAPDVEVAASEPTVNLSEPPGQTFRAAQAARPPHPVAPGGRGSSSRPAPVGWRAQTIGGPPAGRPHARPGPGSTGMPHAPGVPHHRPPAPPQRRPPNPPDVRHPAPPGPPPHRPGDPRDPRSGPSTPPPSEPMDDPAAAAERRKKRTGAILMVVLAGGFAALIVFGISAARSSAGSAGVGDCLTGAKDADEITKVDCAAPEAAFVVLGRVDGVTESDGGTTACVAYPETTRSYWEGKRGVTTTGTAICMKPIAK